MNKFQEDVLWIDDKLGRDPSQWRIIFDRDLTEATVPSLCGTFKKILDIIENGEIEETLEVVNAYVSLTILWNNLQNFKRMSDMKNTTEADRLWNKIKLDLPKVIEQLAQVARGL